MKVIIAGGGIGGLTTALCLHKIGIKVKVFEAVPEIKPLGVGINLLPHSMRVLFQLGLEHPLSEIGVETKELVYFDKFGKQFWQEARGKFAGYKWPQYSLHRGEFQIMLLNKVIETIGKENVLTNHQIQSFTQDQNKVKAKFIFDQHEIIEVEGDCLIGADGINSAVRNQLYPLEGAPKFSKNILYRGTARMKPYLTGSSMVMIGSLKQKMVAYPIHPDIDTNGNQLINWVANLKENEEMIIQIRDWNKRSDKKRLLSKYEKWQFDWLNVYEMINKAEAIYEFPMSDRDPLVRWTFGRVTLLGDAAHPMYPIGSNGASQAILDADALAIAIGESSENIETALVQYENERLPVTSKIVLQNRQKGPDEIMDLMEDRFPNGFTNDQIPHDDLAQVMDNYRVVAGFDMNTLNQKK